MTNREFLNAIINGEITDEVVAMAKAEIEKLDARNEKRRITMTKEQVANEGVKAQIVEFIGDKIAVVASEIAQGVGVSTQKVSALCKQLVDEDKLTVADVKVKGKGSVKGYTVKV